MSTASIKKVSHHRPGRTSPAVKGRKALIVAATPRSRVSQRIQEWIVSTAVYIVGRHHEGARASRSRLPGTTRVRAAQHAARTHLFSHATRGPSEDCLMPFAIR